MPRWLDCAAHASCTLKKMMMRKALAVWVGLALCSASCVFAQMSPVGLWQSINDETNQPEAEIRITTVSSGLLNGAVEKILMQGVEPTCTLCTDDRKDKPKLGMEIIRGAKKAQGKDVWEDGKILDPENGKNYTLRMTPIEGGKKLEVRGSFGPFGRTQTWNRMQ